MEAGAQLSLPTPTPNAAAAARDAAQAFSREVLARELNPAQLEAALHPPGPLLVVAGAGSGKTRVITYRLATLVAAGADPKRIVAVTFTNKAAGELRERADKLLWERLRVGTRGLWVGTFHSISARLLRQLGGAVGIKKDFVIYDDDDQKRLLGRVLTDLKVPERMFPVRQVLSAIDRAKNEGITADRFQAQASDYLDDVVAKAYHLYEERLAAAGATDFGGLLLKMLELASSGTPAAQELAERFDHVLVDEFQDTNNVQYRLVRMLSRRTGSMTVVGDEDQSIYRWRGAEIRNILEFEADHPDARVVKLEQNYRSTGYILKTANAIIEKNASRRPKRLFTEAGDGEQIVMFEGETERDEAEFVAGRIEAALSATRSPRDFAVFYRTNAQSRVLEDALRARDLPYIVVGGTRFFDRSEIKDLVCYLRAIANPDDGMALQRIVNVPARGIGAATVDRISDLVYERKISAWEALKLASAEGAEGGQGGSGGDALLGTAPRKKVAAFVQLMEKLREVGVGLGPAALAEKVLELTGYSEALAAESTMEAEGRLENLMEMVAQMREYEKEAEEPTLHGFLERIALQSDVDGYDPEKGAVSLMTVHTAKGLEFPVVFLTGLEERIFPHARSVDDDAAVEEERRLCYVAVTRARALLHLSRVRRRRLSGQELPGVPSRFLRDVPPECVESIVMARPAGYGGGYGESEGQGPWGGRWSRPQGDDDVPAYQLRGGGARAGGGGAPAPSGFRARSGVGPGPAAAAAAKKAKAAAAGGELTVHYDDDGGGHDGDGSPGLQVGAKLRHPSFGVGEVRGWQGAGSDLKVIMKFPHVGVKTIVARFLTKP